MNRLERETIERRIREFSDVAGRATDSLALMLVLELGAFGHLVRGPKTLPELARASGSEAGRLRPFLDLVVGAGFLTRDGDRYALLEGDELLFDPDGPWREALGFSDTEAAFTRYSQAPRVLRDGRPVQVAGSGGDVPAEQRRSFLRYLHRRSVDVAEEVAALLCSAPVRRIADLGSGLGTYAGAILDRVPEAEAVLVDRANAADAVAEFVAERGLGSRVTFVGGDFLEDDFGDGFDLAIVSNIIHNLGASDSVRLLRRLHGLLVPGGRVAIKDLEVDSDRLGPHYAVRFAAAMALFTEHGDVFPAQEVESWLAETGFALESTTGLQVGSGSYLVVGRRS